VEIFTREINRRTGSPQAGQTVSLSLSMDWTNSKQRPMLQVFSVCS
jgi:hypothetical protein